MQTLQSRLPILFCTVLAALLGTTACNRHKPTAWQGYFEGEFVYVAAPLSGQLATLSVQRGAQVAVGDPLFTLEHTVELAAQREAAQRTAAAEAHVADLRKGARPSEIATLEARLSQTRAAAELSSIELERQEKLHAANVNSNADYDRARLAHAQNLDAITGLRAQLETAQLGARSDVIAAAEAEARAATEAKARADWSVAQKTQAAPQAGLVYDTLYRPGEFVAAANPVVVLLPPENIKVRFFVPQGAFASLKAGDAVTIRVDGREDTITAHISYLSPQPEYTPPVLYNRDNRSKLTYMIEATLAPDAARSLHPGQPVDVFPAN